MTRVRPRALLIAWLVATCWLLGLPTSAAADAAVTDQGSGADATRAGTATSGDEEVTALRAQRPVVVRTVRAELPAPLDVLGAPVDRAPAAAGALLVLLVLAAALPVLRASARHAVVHGRAPPAASGRRR